METQSPVKHIPPSCAPHSKQELKEVPTYLHVRPWKPPQGIEAQAGILYYHRSPNLQQKPKMETLDLEESNASKLIFLLNPVLVLPG